MNGRPTPARPGAQQQRAAGGDDLAPGDEAARPWAATACGVLMICAGSALLMGVVTAEALFPAVISTSHTTLSALGSTWNPGDVVHQPSATVFDTTMLVTGLMIAVSAVLLYRATGRGSVSVAVGVLGSAVLLVGVFPGEMIDGQPSSGGVHPVVSLAAFVAGAVAALLGFRVAVGPFRYVSAALGLIAVLALGLQGPLGDSALGNGGLERWIAYPTVLWLVAFGGYLLGARPRRASASTGGPVA